MYSDFRLKAGDPQVVQAILARVDLQVVAELEGLNDPAFAAFKVLVAKNKSMERLVDHCIQTDTQMGQLEAWEAGLALKWAASP